MATETTLMDHKYGRLSMEKAPESAQGDIDQVAEPAFVLRANDILAHSALLRYRDMAASLSDEDRPDAGFFASIDASISAFSDYAARNQYKVRIPD